MTMMMMKDNHTRRKQEEPPQPPPPPPPTYNTNTPGGGVASPGLSSSSSPSHDDFSFTISLHPSNTELPAGAAADGAKTKPSAPAFTAGDDLSPADDIFLHGHLLPLRLLSHLPISPRSSTNSVDSFTLPIIKNFQNSTTTTHLAPKKDTNSSKDSKPKSPFSFFSLSKRKKELPLKNRAERSKPDPTIIKGFSRSYLDKEEKEDDKEKQWRKLKWEITQAVKRYARMMKPLFSSLKGGGGGGGGGGGRRKVEVDRKAHSFSSGTINVTRGSRSDNNITNRRSAAAFGGGRGLGVGEYSAPASTRTSPTNSGLLVAQPRPPLPPPSESTMEELQAAIQAAIAHCKKSIAVEGGEEDHDNHHRKSNATVA